jgi:hypothetical protein
VLFFNAVEFGGAGIASAMKGMKGTTRQLGGCLAVAALAAVAALHGYGPALIGTAAIAPALPRRV